MELSVSELANLVGVAAVSPRLLVVLVIKLDDKRRMREVDECISHSGAVLKLISHIKELTLLKSTGR